MHDTATTIDALRRKALDFRDQRDWWQFHSPNDLALGLAIEVGELAELFLWKDTREIEAALRSPHYRARLQDESADVLIFLLYLSDVTGIDQAEAVEAKLRQNAEKYPVGKAFGSARKYTQLGGE